MTTTNGVYHKISDQSLGAKPFDSFLLKGDGYLVLSFRLSGKTYFVNIKEYVAWIETHPSIRSLTESDVTLMAEIETRI